MSAIMRVLCSESIEVTGDRAVCSWRDLWTAVEGGSARWVAHRYGVDAVRDEGQWRFARMTRHRLLDCPYDRGWTATPFTDLRAIGA
jgi:hypothetical protein